MKKYLLFILGFLPLILVAQPYRDMTQADSYVLLGSERMLNQSYDAALSAFDNAIKMDPNHWCAYHFRGSVLMLMNQYDQALEDLNEAIRLNSTNPVLFYKRGMVFDILGDQREAAFDFQRALELAPDYPEAARKLDQLNRYNSRRGKPLSRGSNRPETRMDDDEYRPYRTSRSMALAREYDIPTRRSTYDEIYEDRPQVRPAARDNNRSNVERQEENSRFAESRYQANSRERSYDPYYRERDDFSTYDKFRRSEESRSNSSQASPRSWRDYATRDIQTQDDDEIMSQQKAEEMVETTFFDDPEPESRSMNWDEQDEREKTSSTTMPIEEAISFDPYAGSGKKKLKENPFMGNARGGGERGSNTLSGPIEKETHDFSRSITLQGNANTPYIDEQPSTEDKPIPTNMSFIAKQASPGNKSVYVDHVELTQSYTQIDFKVHGDDETITMPPPRIKLQVEGKVYHLYYGQNTQPKTYQLRKGFPETFSIKFQPIPANTEFIKILSDGSKPSERWNYVFKLIEK